MCRGCFEEYGSPSIFNEKTAEGARLVAALYEVNCVGGAAHIVTDDWNVEDDNVQWCLDNLDKYWQSELAEAKAVLEAFRAMTVDERVSALAINAGYISPPR